MPLAKVKKKFFFGWWIVAASFTILFLVGGVYHGLSAIFDSLVKEFGWRRAVISGAYSLRGLESGIFTPFVGFFVDSLGPRRILLFGIVLTGLGTVGMGSVHSLWQLYAALAVMSLGLSACGSPTVGAAVVNWFSKRRGMALGLATSGPAVAGLLVFVIARLVAAYGWRASLFIAGTAIILIGIPVSLVVRHKPEQYGYLPDGDESGPGSSSSSSWHGVRPGKESAAKEQEIARFQGVEPDFTTREAVRTWAFWLIALALVLQFMGTGAMAVHEIPFLTSIGMSPQNAALVMSLTVFLGLAGRLGLGWLGDMFDKRRVMAVAFFLQAVGLLIFATIRSPWQVVPFLITYGMTYGAGIPLRGAMQGDYFGRSSFGAIQGLLFGIMTLCGLVGPILAGWIFDSSGSYRPAFVALAVMAALAVPAILAVKPPRRKPA